MATEMVNGESGMPQREDIDQLSFHEQFAAMQIRENIAEIQDGIAALPAASSDRLEAINDSLYDGKTDTVKSFKVCIIGAGSAGLFTAMIFNHLKKKYKLDVEYEIVGANGPDRVDAFNIKDIPENQNPVDMITEHVQKFLTVYKDWGAKEFWRILMKYGDKYSVRQYLGKYANFDYYTIEFLETLNFGNRWYDQAFSEMVCETLDFGDKSTKWKCVMGGSQQIAYRMRDKILKERSSSITYNSVVNRVGYIEVDDLDKENVEVGFKDGISKTFHAVFNSAPLGAQQHMKLDLLNLNWGNKLAIGSLAYGASCKIGIRFKKMWWITKCGIKGGVAKTDRSIRACVYPSYNVYDDPEQPGVLLASYTWSAEAERIGSLIQRGSPKDEEELKELLFHDPALLHARDADPESYKDMYDIIKEQYMDHFAYDWGSDKRQVGAFAYFGPGQFSDLWNWITRTDGKYIIIGECASAHHAWVVGSLESAVRGVYQFLFQRSRHSKAAYDALQAYNRNEVAWPYGPLPAEYNRTKDIKYMTKQKSEGYVSPVGELARQQVMVETIRLEQQKDQLKMESVKKSQLVDFFPSEVLYGAVSTNAAETAPVIRQEA